MDTDDNNCGHSSSSSSSSSFSSSSSSSTSAASASASSSVSSSSSSTENITNEEEEERNIFERVEHVIERNDVNRNIIAINEVQLENNGVIFDDYNHPLIDIENMHKVVCNEGDLERRLLDQRDSTLMACLKAVKHGTGLMVEPNDGRSLAKELTHVQFC